MPSRTQFRKLLEQRHRRAKDEMKSLLKEQTSAGIALTTDGWTSCATQSYVTHTVHYIDNNRKLASGVLETARFRGSHTAERLAAVSRNVVESFGVKEEVVAITHDEAANMVAAGRKLSDDDGWESTVCMAHQLQTIIRHTLDSSSTIQRVLACCRKLLGYFKHSSSATDILHDKQLALKKDQQPLTVVQDVSTRWNSTFYMVRRLLQLRSVLTVVLTDPALTKKKDDRDLFLKESEWRLASDLVLLLEEYEQATTVVGGQSYLTLSLLMLRS